MGSTRARQRKLERDRYERKLVRQAQRQRRRRQVQAGIGAFLAIAVIGAGVAWLAGVFEPGPDQDPLAEPDQCPWLPRDPAENPDRVEVGTPPANPPTSGVRTMSIDLDAGASGAGSVEVAIEVDPDPCGVASMGFLANQGFLDGTTCHELVEQVALRCGDPSGTGLGGPSYAFYGANLPVPPAEGSEEAEEPVPEPTYPAGTVAFADAAGENGSQFLIFYEDYSPENPLYPLLGTVISGLEVVQQIGKAGGAGDQPAQPVEEVRIESLVVIDPTAAPTGLPTQTPTAAPTG